MEVTSTEPTAESSTGEDKVDKVEEAHKLLATGKRHLLCGEVHNAIESLQTACQLLSEKFGETADECGEAYFFYGKARLELSRMESGVLGNALTGVPEEGDTEEEDVPESTTKETKEVVEKDGTEWKEEERDEELAAQVYDAMAEKSEEEKQDAETMEKDGKEEPKDAEKKEETGEEKPTEESKKAEEKDTKGKSPEKKEADAKKDASEDKPEEKKEADAAKDSEKKEEEKPGEEAKKDEKEAAEDGKTAEKTDGEEKMEETEGDEEGEEGDEEGEEGEEGDEEKEEDDVSNIQLAWETIDLARVIFARQEGKDMQLKTAQAHLKLGEVSLELENYEQAVKDFQACLTIQQKHLEADDRLIAETCYQLGVAYSYNRQFPESRDQLNAALKTVKDRKSKLQKTVEECGSDNAKADEKKTAEDELKELDEIIPDIEAKIKDTEEEEKEMKEMAKNEAKKMFEAGASGAGTSSGFGESSASSTDATSTTDKPVNVLVPRKRKPEDDAANDSKKSRQEDEKNGDVTSSDAKNGHTANGDHAANGDSHAATNGDAPSNGAGDSKVETTEIKTKTVEDVLTEKAEADAKMDTA